MAQSLEAVLERVLNKIEDASARSVQQAGEYVEQEFSELIQDQVYSAYSPKVYSRTGALGESPRMVHLTSERFIVVFRDMGNWESVNGEPFYALYGLEGGYTWGRPATNIMSEVTSYQFKSGIAEEYKEAMITQGIPIK